MSTTVRGFLVQTPDGRLFLTSQPNLKSCCLHKEQITKIELVGDLPTKIPKKRVVCHGIMTEKSQFLLQEGIQCPSSCAPFVLGAALLISVFIVIFIKKIKRH